MIEQEPMGGEDFTREELMLIHTALCNEALHELFPPKESEKMRLVASVRRKIFNKLNLAENDNEGTLDCGF